MKAIVLPQPYASAVLDGFTAVYSTGRRIRYRGRVAIVAARHRHFLRDHYRLRRAGYQRKTYQLGALLGTVDLVDCKPADAMPEPDPFGSGRYCLIFRRPTWCDQAIVWRASTSVFEIPDLYLEPAEPEPIDGRAAAYTPSSEE